MDTLNKYVFMREKIPLKCQICGEICFIFRYILVQHELGVELSSKNFKKIKHYVRFTRIWKNLLRFTPRGLWNDMNLGKVRFTRIWKILLKFTPPGLILYTYSVIPIKRTVLLTVLFGKSGECTVWFYYCYVLPIKSTVLKVRRMYCLILLLLCTSY